METRGSTLRDFGDTKTFACAAIAVARFDGTPRGCYDRSAGWSSLVARWAHNPKVGGSNPPPATKTFYCHCLLAFSLFGYTLYLFIYLKHSIVRLGRQRRMANLTVKV